MASSRSYSIKNTPMVGNLTELVDSLRNTPFNSTEDAFEHLADLVGPTIRIRYEVLKGSESTNQEAPEQDRTVRRSRFSHLNNLVVRRVLLTSNRNTADFTSELVQQCNGVVLEYPSWKILAVPPPMFNPRYRLNNLKAKANENGEFNTLNVYEVRDGTTVTLYFYDGRWCLASANGFEVNDYQFLGNHTYMSAFLEAAKQYPAFSLATCFSTEQCYTCGFRHHDFHPLQADPQGVWLIQVYNLKDVNTGKVRACTDVSVAIPMQKPIQLPQGVNPVQWMTAKNQDALTRYFSATKTTEKSEKASTPEIHYGFILRGSFAENGELSNIMLESTLMKMVRQLMYNLPKGKYTQIVPNTPAKRLDYTILRAYLSYRSKYNFLNLFPQFTGKYDEYNDLFGKLVSRIFNAFRNKQIRASLRGGDKKRTLSSKIDTLALAFIPYIEKEVNINPFDAQGQNIILDFITDSKYIDIFYTCLIDDTTE